jgi:ectoine hydroxylase-related dioxygenase (phytanoyl-CoA dioxygenase family)
VLTQPLARAPLDREARCAQGERDGYLYLPQLVPEEALAPLRALVDDALVRREWIARGHEPLRGPTDPALRFGRWDDQRWFGFLGEVLPSEAYRSVAELPALVEVLREVLGAEPELHVGDVCRLVSPGDPALTTPPHQDAAYLREAERVWTAWMALAPCPREMGPLAIWAGSHRGGVRPHAPVEAGGGVVGTSVPDDAVWSTGDLALGDVVVFSSMVVHRALDNASADRLRVSVDYRYRPRTSGA